MAKLSLQQLEELVKAAARVTHKPRRNAEVKRDEVPDISAEEVPVGLHGILSASEKLLAVNRGLVPPDERDSQQFKQIHTTDQLMRERVRLDADKTRLNTLRQAAKFRSLKRVHPFLFDAYTEGHLLGNPLSMPLEEINTMHLLEQQRRITQMGPGGLGSSEAITDEARALHPSQFGFLSTIEGPECYDDQTEVFTWKGWVPWTRANAKMKFACRVNGRLEFHTPSKFIEQPYSGEMFGVNTQHIKFCVTPNHRVFTTGYNTSPHDWGIETAADHYQKSRRYETRHAPFTGVYRATFLLPEIPVRSNAQRVYGELNFDDFSELLGWYLGEGCYKARIKKGSKDWHDGNVRISQSLARYPEHCQRIATLLDRMPFSWSYADRAFHIPGKQLAAYFSQFGYSPERWIPEEFLTAHESARQRLYEALILAEARKSVMHTSFCSTSIRLTNDFERLAISLGHSTNRHIEQDKRPHVKTTNYIVTILREPSRVAIKKYHFKKNYNGVVYCATVPGGLLYVRRGDGIGLWSGNSERIGIDTRVAWGTKMGSDGKIYQRFFDKHKQKHRWLSPEDLSGHIVVGLPE